MTMSLDCDDIGSGRRLHAYDGHQSVVFAVRDGTAIDGLIAECCEMMPSAVPSRFPAKMLSDAILEEYGGNSDAEAVAEMLASLSRPVNPQYCGSPDWLTRPF